MKQLLEHSSQWGPIAGLIICFTVFILVLLYQIFDRRKGFQQHMRSLPLDADTQQGDSDG